MSLRKKARMKIKIKAMKARMTHLQLIQAMILNLKSKNERSVAKGVTKNASVNEKRKDVERGLKLVIVKILPYCLLLLSNSYNSSCSSQLVKVNC